MVQGLPDTDFMRLFESKDLVGRTVIDAAGRALGEITGLILDPEEWKVLALRLRLRKGVADAIKIPRGRFRAASVAVPTHLVLGAGDTVVLKVTAAGLRQVPEPSEGEATPPAPH